MRDCQDRFHESKSPERHHQGKELAPHVSCSSGSKACHPYVSVCLERVFSTDMHLDTCIWGYYTLPYSVSPLVVLKYSNNTCLTSECKNKLTVFVRHLKKGCCWVRNTFLFIHQRCHSLLNLPHKIEMPEKKLDFNSRKYNTLIPDIKDQHFSQNKYRKKVRFQTSAFFFNIHTLKQYIYIYTDAWV